MSLPAQPLRLACLMTVLAPASACGTFLDASPSSKVRIKGVVEVLPRWTMDRRTSFEHGVQITNISPADLVIKTADLGCSRGRRVGFLRGHALRESLIRLNVNETRAFILTCHTGTRGDGEFQFRMRAVFAGPYPVHPLAQGIVWRVADERSRRRREAGERADPGPFDRAKTGEALPLAPSERPVPDPNAW